MLTQSAAEPNQQIKYSAANENQCEQVLQEPEAHNKMQKQIFHCTSNKIYTNHGTICPLSLIFD
jgi:hypothetical protein